MTEQKRPCEEFKTGYSSLESATKALLWLQENHPEYGVTFPFKCNTCPKWHLADWEKEEEPLKTVGILVLPGGVQVPVIVDHGDNSFVAEYVVMWEGKRKKIRTHCEHYFVEEE